MGHRDVAAEETQMAHERKSLGYISGFNLQPDIGSANPERIQCGLVEARRGRVPYRVADDGKPCGCWQGRRLIQIIQGVDGFHAQEFQIEVEARIASRSNLAGHWPGAVSFCPMKP
ncbi:MAG: hypothetical protein RL346_1965 [Verrucomicrobiota bacterium]